MNQLLKTFLIPWNLLQHTKNLYAAYVKIMRWGFPGGAVVKNPPASAGDTGSSPGPGRSHMQSN